MDHQSNELTSADRLRWLAELAVAIEDAQDFAGRIGISDSEDPEVRDLYSRLEAAGREVEALRRGSWVGSIEQLDPIWMSLLPYQQDSEELQTPWGKSPPPANS